MMGWIDLLVSIYLAIFFIIGLKKDLTSALKNLISIILSFIISLLFYKQGSAILMIFFPFSEPVANVLSFFFDLLLFKILIQMALLKPFTKFNLKFSNPAANKIASGTASYFLGMFIIFLTFSIILSFSLPYVFDKEIRSSSTGKIINADILGINENFKKIFGNLLATTTAKLDFLTTSNEEETKSTNLPFKIMEYKFDEDAEKEMLALINIERTKTGLDPLVMDEEIKKTARKHGTDMFENAYFSHTNLQEKNVTARMRDAGIKFNFSGENLALSQDVFSAHNGLMHSPGHRKNILQVLYHRIGIGVVDAKPYGIIFVQNFAD